MQHPNKSTPKFYSQPQKLLDNSMSNNLLGFSLKKPKDGFIKTPSLSSIAMLWVSILSTAWCCCNFQTHQHWLKGEGHGYEKTLEKVVAPIFFVTGLSKVFKFLNQIFEERMNFIGWNYAFLEMNDHTLPYHLRKKKKKNLKILNGGCNRLFLVQAFTWMLR